MRQSRIARLRDLASKDRLHFEMCTPTQLASAVRASVRSQSARLQEGRSAPPCAGPAQLRMRVQDIPSLDVVAYVTAPSRLPEFAGFTAPQIWAAIQKHKQGDAGGDGEETDLKIAEWAVLTQNPPPPPTKDFRVTRVPPPSGFSQFFEDTILLEKLREVRALLAFTRIESKGDFADAAVAARVRSPWRRDFSSLQGGSPSVMGTDTGGAATGKGVPRGPHSLAKNA